MNARLALLLAPRKNLFTNTDLSTWTQNGVTTALADVRHITGALAYKVTEAAASSVHVLRRDVVPFSETYTVSFSAKANERGFAWVTMDGGSNSTYFNLTTGAVATNNAGLANIVPEGDGWYRCALSRALTDGSFAFFIGMTSADATQSYLGDGTSSIYLTKPRLERGYRPA